MRLTFALSGCLVAALAMTVPAVATVPAVLSGEPRIIDGDTLDLNGIRVRIHGIDAPERGQTCDGPAGSRDCGHLATQAARDLVAGRQVDCHDLGERTHNRVVARCLVDGQDFAEQMLRLGVVQACPAFADRHAHSRGYLALERHAQRHGLGLFAGNAPPRAGFCRTAATRGLEVLTVSTASAGDCRIKGNISRGGERIYHLPGQRDYARTIIDTVAGERWFCTEAEARTAGWRRAQR